MVRTQIQLTEAQARKVKQLARRRKTSMAAVIRASIDRELGQEAELDFAELRKRATEVVGAFHSGLGDVARRHDDYLADAYSE